MQNYEEERANLYFNIYNFLFCSLEFFNKFGKVINLIVQDDK